MTIREEIEQRYPRIVAGYRAGNRKAAIRLFCLECTGGSRKEVTQCTATGCALFPFRTSQSPAKTLSTTPESKQPVPSALAAHRAGEV
jgi:hypothetical protein